MYKYLIYFLIFSFLGWCTEVVFHLFKCRRLVNRGLAKGPFCPIYGVGICMSALLLGSINNFILLSLLSMAVATAVELAVGYLTHRALSYRLWDYTSERGNILGYVCPRFSVIWGVICALAIKLLPLFDPLVDMIDRPIFRGVAFLLLVAVLADEGLAMSKPKRKLESA